VNVFNCKDQSCGCENGDRSQRQELELDAHAHEAVQVVVVVCKSWL
jgi:hypothetical protein